MVPPVVVNGVMFDLVTGQGVEGDVTLVVHNRNNIVSDSAEARGTFRIVDAPPGPAMVCARANSYAPYFNTFDVDAGKHYSLRVGLLLEAAASGVVLDSAGEPAPGAEVRAIYDDSFRGAHLFASLAGGENTNADDEGAFSARRLGAGHAATCPGVPRRQDFQHRRSRSRPRVSAGRYRAEVAGLDEQRAGTADGAGRSGGVQRHPHCTNPARRRDGVVGGLAGGQARPRRAGSLS